MISAVAAASVTGACSGATFGASVFAGDAGMATGADARPIGGGRAFLGVLGNEEAQADVWRGPFLRWHGDHFDPPPGAEVLARDAGTVQAFRHANRLGMQFHPEATAPIVEGWVARYADRVDGPAVLAAARALARPDALYAEMLRSVM